MEGWDRGKATSNSGKEKELLRREAHPTDTIASGDESSMNFPGKPTSQNPLHTAYFGE
jgi:hypothetical protein